MIFVEEYGGLPHPVPLPNKNTPALSLPSSFVFLCITTEMNNINNDGFVRADQIDLKSLDEQLERHLTRVWTMEKNKNNHPPTATKRQEWEIDPSKLIIKSALARGTYGTVHRGVYDGVDVADCSRRTRVAAATP
ncbi:hypothetical protein HanLR1_Chr09g0337391 [Helianthus annuus]|nr:hypothetical protein HanLR1_Chr09g0337391 [Helianthus annuus]